MGDTATGDDDRIVEPVRRTGQVGVPQHLRAVFVSFFLTESPLAPPPAGYRGRMASHPARPQLGLFDNPVRVFSLDELAETVRKLERERPGRTVEELSGAVFAELAIKRTRRAADLVAEAIRLARPRPPRTEITGTQWHAATSEVRAWALSAGFELAADGTVPGPAITAYNQIHPDRPY